MNNFIDLEKYRSLKEYLDNVDDDKKEYINETEMDLMISYIKNNSKYVTDQDNDENETIIDYDNYKLKKIMISDECFISENLIKCIYVFENVENKYKKQYRICQEIYNEYYGFGYNYTIFETYNLKSLKRKLNIEFNESYPIYNISNSSFWKYLNFIKDNYKENKNQNIKNLKYISHVYRCQLYEYPPEYNTITIYYEKESPYSDLVKYYTVISEENINKITIYNGKVELNIKDDDLLSIILMKNNFD